MKKIVIILLVAGVIVWGGVLYLEYFKKPTTSQTNTNSTSTTTLEPTKLVKFSSAQDFKDYLEKTSQLSTGYSGLGLGTLSGSYTIEDIGPTVGLGASESMLSATKRASDTNVQVKGIDEPDIVKTDGTNIYFSPEQSYYYLDEIMPSEKTGVQTTAKTKIIKAQPVSELSETSSIDQIGNLLLNQNTLIVFSNNKIYGYDIADPKSPKETWKMELDSRTNVESARLYNNKLYLVTRMSVYSSEPCPIKPLTLGTETISIACTDIYHPETEVPVNTTYTAFVINPINGEVDKKVAFVGYTGSSVVYMSQKAIYVTYSYYGDIVDFYYNFIVQEAKDLFPDSVIEKIKKLEGYEISTNAKLTELSSILENFTNSLDKNELLKVENEISNRMSDYYKANQRTLEKSGIVKIPIETMAVSANGAVPGHPLNQFSLDEYNDNLRIATTIGTSSGFGFGLGGSSESLNDVYVLDSDLKITGSVKDLGKGESIYSVRFIEDKGYVVTFRQTDPFYVLDLSDPKNPELKGELKIPGYSSYLHPLKTNLILGIGEENQKVKLSVFDVSDPANPSEKSKYSLDEYWTEVQTTHHAFLQDEKHEIFFLPGSAGGYVFSYKNNELSLSKAVSDFQVKRAIYINDYLYVIGESKITVLNETDWKEAGSLELK